MRGGDGQQAGMFSYVSPERRIPADHPLRPVREMTDEVLRQLSPRFARLYPKTGRPSVAPEKLLRALLLQVLYSVRSERLLMEQLEYNLLFRWFVGLSMDDPVWDVTVFTKNRERLLRGDIAEAFFQRVLELWGTALSPATLRACGTTRPAGSGSTAAWADPRAVTKASSSSLIGNGFSFRSTSSPGGGPDRLRRTPCPGSCTCRCRVG